MVFLLVVFPGPDYPLSARFMLDLFVVVTDVMSHPHILLSVTLWAFTEIGGKAKRKLSAFRDQ